MCRWLKCLAGLRHIYSLFAIPHSSQDVFPQNFDVGMQSQGWSLFQKSLPEPDLTILIGRLQSIHDSDVVAFLELMLSTESLSKILATD